RQGAGRVSIVRGWPTRSSVAKAIDPGAVARTDFMVRTITPGDRGRPQPKSQSLRSVIPAGVISGGACEDSDMDFADLELLRQIPYLRSVAAAHLQAPAPNPPPRLYCAA